MRYTCVSTLRRIARSLVVAGALLALASPLAAQTVTNPTTLQFTASPDHNATTSDGQALVSRYDLSFYTVGGTSPLLTYSLGKPTPDASNTITVSLDAVVTTWPPPGVTYEARVTAVGPGGSSDSLPSNTFSMGLTCGSTLASGSASVAAAAGTGSVGVTIGAGCTWTATSNASWITVTAGATGSGSGTVSYSFTANTSTSSRSGTITIAGQTYTVTQAGITCSYTLSPTSVSVSSAATTGSVSVTSAAGCTWTAASNNSWITVTSGASGSGNGSVGYSITARTNTFVAHRHDHDWWTDVHRHAGRSLHVYAGRDQRFRRCGSGHGQRQCHGRHRLCLDGDEQCELDHGHRRRERIGQRHGELLVHGQPERHISQRDDHDRRPDLHGHASGCRVHLHLVSDVALQSLRRRERAAQVSRR